MGNLHCFFIFILVFSITFENDNFWFDIKSKQAVNSTLQVYYPKGVGGGGWGRSRHEFTNNNFAFHEP